MMTRERDEERSAGTRARAWLWLGAWAVATLALVGVATSPDPNPPFVPPPGATSDQDYFRHVVERVRGGESFHDAAHVELLTHGYPSRSVFNWRTPVYAWVFAALPNGQWCRALLCLGVAVTILLWSRILLADVGLWAGTLGVLALVGAMGWCVGTLNYLFTEVWAGMLLALSLALRRSGWRGAAVAAGLSALFLRELALPFVLLSAWFAWRERRRVEALAWGIGTAGFVLLMFVHAQIVAGRMTSVDQAITGGWVRFGGLRFVLQTSQTNVFLMGPPLWVTAIVLPIAIVGLLHATTDDGRLLAATVVTYLAAFSLVGAPFNFYWGFLIAPSLAIGIAWAPSAFTRLLNEALPRFSTNARADLPA
ncbi:MAG: hypothetical protein AB7I30_20995 [Isosphaeraceae bacterium]